MNLLVPTLTGLSHKIYSCPLLNLLHYFIMSEVKVSPQDALIMLYVYLNSCLIT